jgi:hypothetical protein
MFDDTKTQAFQGIAAEQISAQSGLHPTFLPIITNNLFVIFAARAHFLKVM